MVKGEYTCMYYDGSCLIGCCVVGSALGQAVMVQESEAKLHNQTHQFEISHWLSKMRPKALILGR